MRERLNPLKNKNLGIVLIVGVTIILIILVGIIINNNIKDKNNAEKYRDAVIIEFKDERFEKIIRKKITE